MGDLSPKQRRFVDEYLIDLNGAQAAIRAGYSERTARKIAYEHLTKPDIVAAIQSKQAEIAARNEWTQQRVIEQLEPIAESDIGDVLDFAGETLRLRSPCEIPEAARKAISSMKVKRYLEGKGDDAREVEVIEFKFWDKQTATDQLTRHFGWYKKNGDAGDSTAATGEVLGHVERILRLVMDRVRTVEVIPVTPRQIAPNGNGGVSNGNGHDSDG